MPSPRHFIRFCLGLAILLLGIAHASPLPRATPESAGLDSAKLSSMLDYLRTQGFETESVLLARHGKLVLDAYYAPFRPGMPHQVNSVAKSVTATLVGQAISDGRLNLTDTVGEILPQYRDLPAAKITVEELLQMKSGMIWNDFVGRDRSSSWEKIMQHEDWIGEFLRQPIDPEQIGTFNYNSVGSALLAAMTEKAVGRPLLEYAQERLFGPLGIDNFRWLTTTGGQINGGRGLYITPADMLRFGELFRQNGQWQGQEIVPAAWASAATQPVLPVQANTENPYYYGYHWWVFKDRQWFAARGWGGQYIVVYPAEDMTLVVTSRRPDGERNSTEIDFTALREYFITPATSSLPANPAAFAKLQAKAANWGETIAVKNQRSPLEKRLNGRTIEIGSDFWFSRLEMKFKGNELMLGVTTRDVGNRPLYQQSEPTWQQVAGLDGQWRDTPRPPVKNQIVQSGPESLISSRAQWLDQKTLLLETLWLDESWAYRIKLNFDGNKVRLEQLGGVEVATGTLR
ncbi:serine hydrolase domain-containing protein [Chitinilyticum aquatile]|uniref:serine hydrolase domain-containing protein n=1 Tax=Chitinilyticum aquatile TaxID=362520 RepID=UPI0005516AD5|nr:serine hydrolase [Chitinilyticum aquatile]